MVIVYVLEKQAEARSIFARSPAISKDCDALIRDGLLAEELKSTEMQFAGDEDGVIRKETDFFGGIRARNFCTSRSICEKMDLESCEDITLYPFTLNDDGKEYVYLSINNVIDVRDRSKKDDFELPTKSKPNSMYRIDPRHPKISRTMLFTMPWAGVEPGSKLSHRTTRTFYAYVSGNNNEYDFLKLYHSLKLTGIQPIELCRYPDET